ncbi:MAG: hypothetical protein ABIO74_06045 [Dokdonella sp.]
MIFGWFHTKEVKHYATSVAKEYERLRKSSAMRMDDTPKRARKVDRLVREVKEFKREKKLNFYKSAVMVSGIRQGLRTQGIPEPEVSAFVNSVLLTDMTPRIR